jgi:hypothetical protein
MAKSTQDAVRDARNDVAKTISRAMRALKIGIGAKTAEQIRLGFEQDQRNAPMWVHAALRLGSAYVTTQGQNATPNDRGGLAVVVVAPSASVEAWQQQANAFRDSAKPKVLDVPVAASTSEKK